MSVYNQFFSKCQRFLTSFVDAEAPSPTYERFTQLLVQHLLCNPDLPYEHPLHPFHRYAAEELDIDDSIANLAADMEGSLVQEDLGHLRLTFFAKQGFCRPDVEWLVEWFTKYADASTGLGEFNEAEWEEEEEGEVEEGEVEEEEEEIAEEHHQQLIEHAAFVNELPLPLWNPNLIHNVIPLGHDNNTNNNQVAQG